ncbi:TRAP transporter substrate-binding protein [Hirschia baltica]|uniref:TRAP dicarboxylate transporter, DctP subunit n=1 Tax=Hirschia baltica (strain ATCC 49814 / DSM 5838 / IFAM 1418) TaxID=582402 RepID=C6XQG2_HIRBI|nr:TRAP transporter substrate-binding protein [Hirschia baltica]ACT60461.1 TRAP dicarboxylate transporter, DctP subunit [Hirschia baltica ATCC 49814]
MTQFSRRHVMSIAGSACLSFPLSGCNSNQPALIAADALSADYPTVAALTFMTDRLREKTDGRIKTEIYSGAQLGAERDTLEISMFGGIDFNRVNLAPLNPIAKSTIVPSLPFVFRSIPHMRAAMDGAPGQKILASLAEHDLIGLCFYDSGARSFYNTIKPIRTPDDLKGMKIRVQNSNLYVAMVEALGANATPMSFSEVYQSLVQGVIDGAENNWPSYENTRHFEAARYYSLTQHLMTPEILVMSARRWKMMSDNDRELVMESARESVPFMRQIWDARVNSAMEVVKKSGVEIIETIDKDPFIKCMQPVYDRFLTPNLRELMEEIQDMESADV